MQWRRFVREAEAKLRTQTPDARHELRWMLQDLGIRLRHVQTSEELVPPNILQTVTTWCSRRADDKMSLQHVLKNTPFGSGLLLHVEPPLLCPRPETEQMADWLVQETQGQCLRVLDVGTGTGAIALMVAQQNPNAEVVGIDYHVQAVACARRNAKANSVSNVRFEQLELTATTTADDMERVSAHRTFDIMVSNPPYIQEDEWEELQPEVRLWEDRRALCSGHDGLNLIRTLIQFSSTVLAPHKDALLVIEFGGDKQVPVLSSLLFDAGFAFTVHKDYFGRDRWVSAKHVRSEP